MTDSTASPPARRGASPSRRRILGFCAPLVLTSQLLALSGPVLDAATGHASDLRADLAARWIGYTLLVFLSSPSSGSRPRPRSWRRA